MRTSITGWRPRGVRTRLGPLPVCPCGVSTVSKLPLPATLERTYREQIGQTQASLGKYFLADGQTKWPAKEHGTPGFRREIAPTCSAPSARDRLRKWARTRRLLCAPPSFRHRPGPSPFREGSGRPNFLPAKMGHSGVRNARPGDDGVWILSVQPNVIC